MMPMNFPKWFQKLTEKGELGEVPMPPQGEIAFYDASQLFSSRDFPRYNPDEVVGRKGLGFYSKIARDDQVKAVMLFLKYATIGRGFTWQVTAEEDTRLAKTQQRFADWADAMLSDIKGTWQDKLLGIQSAHDYGYSLSEKVHAPWKYDGKTWLALRDLKLRPPQTFEFYADDYGNVTSLKQPGTGKSDRSLPYTKFLHYVNRPDVDPLHGESDLRACYRPWWTKDVTLKLWSMYLERMAGGYFVATQEEELTPAERNKLENVAGNRQGATGMVLPKGVKAEVFQPNDTSAYERMLSAQDKALARLLLMPNLLGFSEQGTTGSFAQSQTQLEMFFFYLDARSVRLAEVVKDGLFKELAAWNFGLDVLPNLMPNPLTASQRLEIAKQWGTLVSQNAGINDEAAEEHTRQLLGYPKRPEGATAVSGGLGAVQPTGQPSGGGARSDGDDKSGEEKGEEDDGDSQYSEALSNAPPWVRRVDYAAIGGGSAALEDRFAGDLGEVTLEIFEDLKARALQALRDKAPASTVPAVTKIKGKHLTAIRRVMRRGMEAAWRSGIHQARAELKAAGYKEPLKLAELPGAAGVVPGPGMDKFKAEDFFKDMSFHGTQAMGDGMAAAVRRVLYFGLRASLTGDQLVKQLAEATRPYVSATDPAGAQLTTPARLATIARTNTFTAMNEARLNFFTDEELDGYVKGLEFSAILDSRTTDICTANDGFTAFANSGVWENHRPPLHFNCRSILVPITIDDEDWVPSEGFPPRSAAKGFGGHGAQVGDGPAPKAATPEQKAAAEKKAAEAKAKKEAQAEWDDFQKAEDAAAAKKAANEAAQAEALAQMAKDFEATQNYKAKLADKYGFTEKDKGIYKRAETREEAIAWAYNYGLDDVTLYEQAPPAVYHGLNNAMARAHNNGFRLHWKGASVSQDNSAYAAASHIHVEVGADTMNDVDNFLKSARADIEAEFHVPGSASFDAAFTHETGHGIASGVLRTAEDAEMGWRTIRNALPGTTSDITLRGFRERMDRIMNEYLDKVRHTSAKHGLIDTGSISNLRANAERQAQIKKDFVAAGHADAVSEIDASFELFRLLSDDHTVEGLKEFGTVAKEYYEFEQAAIQTSKDAYLAERRPWYISGYAQQNVHEFMAESYTMVNFSSNPSEFANRVYSLMRYHLRVSADTGETVYE
jgi:SPP1 gp7 family putative phage head morphogenesis protein